MVVRVLETHPREPRGWPGAVARHPYPASRECTVPGTASPGKDQDSKLELWLLLKAYHSHSRMKMEDCKLNHCKLGLLIYKPRKEK